MYTVAGLALASVMLSDDENPMAQRQTGG